MYEDLSKYAQTDTQRDYLKAVDTHGSHRAAAIALCVNRRTVDKCVDRVKKLAALKGWSPSHDMKNTVPEPYVVRGVSTYYDKDGKPKAQWVKSQLDNEAYRDLISEMAELYLKDIPKITIKNAEKRDYKTDVIPWFQIGDAHLGMLSHEAETGENFDLKIAVRELMKAFDVFIDETPNHERCVINDLGDFTHYENIEGETQASKHSLDFDGRFGKMIKAYVPLMRYIVEKCLAHFKYVDVIINQGNHSRTNDIWMRELLNHVYSDSDRLSVMENTNVFIPYRMGNCFVLVHHSDKCRAKQLPAVMSTDYRQDWGEAEFCYIDTGHVHHSFVSKEHPGVKVESFNHLAAADKYAHEGGWRSRQSITRVDRSRTYGEVGRRVLSVEEIRDKITVGYKPKKRRKVYSV